MPVRQIRFQLSTVCQYYVGSPTQTTSYTRITRVVFFLEKNGTRSSGKRTCHPNIPYFLITDRVDKKEVRIEYCPTEVMRPDPHAKTLQVWLFRENREIGFFNIITASQPSSYRSVLAPNWFANRSWTTAVIIFVRR
jgi:hypothetical protein